jgi:hypothetical protein
MRSSLFVVFLAILILAILSLGWIRRKIVAAIPVILAWLRLLVHQPKSAITTLWIVFWNTWTGPVYLAATLYALALAPSMVGFWLSKMLFCAANAILCAKICIAEELHGQKGLRKAWGHRVTVIFLASFTFSLISLVECGMVTNSEKGTPATLHNIWAASVWWRHHEAEPPRAADKPPAVAADNNRPVKPARTKRTPTTRSTTQTQQLPPRPLDPNDPHAAKTNQEVADLALQEADKVQRLSQECLDDLGPRPGGKPPHYIEDSTPDATRSHFRNRISGEIETIRNIHDSILVRNPTLRDNHMETNYRYELQNKDGCWLADYEAGIPNYLRALAHGLLAHTRAGTEREHGFLNIPNQRGAVVSGNTFTIPGQTDCSFVGVDLSDSKDAQVTHNTFNNPPPCGTVVKVPRNQHPTVDSNTVNQPK